ncbi:MAG: histidinol-phosphatase [Ignavibacteriales bacterium]|nr:MAG: histidinol-phosphatase [Ignavibacteriales bacterium]
MTQSELHEFKLFSKKLADKSGEIINKYFRSELSVEFKPDLSPVTIADKKSEEVMREIIMKEYPEHGILGEEFGVHNPGAEYQWVLDPIDGTKSFICGAVTFGTLIALTKKREPVIGVINQPVLKQFLIGDNRAASLNDINANVRHCKKIEDAVLTTTDHFNIGKYFDQNKFDELAKKVQIYRNWGDCYGYYLLSSGFIDIMIDPVMSVWDLMALIPVVKGAGSIITDYRGNDVLKGTSVIAASPAIHPEVIRMLN